jgi:murein DD-endopeptidase MepM/ murein hydrolase activator NlpD
MTRWMLAITVALSAAWLPAAAASPRAGATGSPGSDAAGSSQAAGGSDWSWPLSGAPSVVRGFQPPPRPWLAGHRGVDLLASPGATVFAAGAGRVTFAGWVGGVPVVTVTHQDGRRTTYEPVLAAVVWGQVVARGAILGRVSVGGSHCLPRACLHWGLRLGSTYLDPLSLLGAGSEVRLLPLWSADPATVGWAAWPWEGW